MAQQVNSGFVQSPIHQHKISSLSETSFSGSTHAPVMNKGGQDDGEIGRHTDKSSGQTIPLIPNGGIPQSQHTMISSSSSMPSTTSSTSQPQSMVLPQLNGTINIPVQLYQYLQQMAMMNPSIAALQEPNHTQPFVQAHPSATPQSSHKIGFPVSNQSTSKLEDKPTQPSQIYEEIPSYKIYTETPKLPAPREHRTDPGTDTSPSPSDFRKKVNPLYGDSKEADANRSEPSFSEPLLSQKSIDKRRGCNCCLCFGFIIMTIICCASLALTLLIYTGVFSIQKEALPLTSPTSSVMTPSADNSFNATELLFSYQGALDAHAESLYNRIELLEQQLGNLTESQVSQQGSISALADRLPTGAIDPSLCIHSLKSSVSAASRDTYLNTVWVPVSSQLENGYTLVGATCTYSNYKDIQLNTKDTEGTTVYSCRCSGIADTNVEDKRCSINYWVCPTIT
ncbi:uncharacterized protein [Watersipora subatra]|uniref:uncharacterized protein isoform X2 n=1 Tax=Watersipora subatra TaxID=2589382 RepID=UPI00355BD92C